MGYQDRRVLSHNQTGGHCASCLVLSHNPQHLISISDNQVWQWDVNGHQTKPPFDGQHVSFSSDGAQFVSCHEKTVTVHNSSSGATVSEFQITDSDAYRCSFSPDSRLVAVAAGRTAYCWNITSSKPQLVETFIGHTEDITSLVFSSPTTLISASRRQISQILADRGPINRPSHD
jgi:WD40 repeat protein